MLGGGGVKIFQGGGSQISSPPSISIYVCMYGNIWELVIPQVEWSGGGQYKLHTVKQKL